MTINTGTFNDNDGFGFDILTNGAITVTSVTADDNLLYGVTMASANPTSPKTILVNKGHFNGNTMTGLNITNNGGITLNGVTASENLQSGAFLHNANGTAGVTILSSYGANTFNGNTWRGLNIQSKGNIMMSNVTSSENLLIGIIIDNYQAGEGTGYITMTKVTTWSNTQRGIDITTNGIVTMDGVSSVLNGAAGYSGIAVYSHDHNLIIKNSLVTSNGAWGVSAHIGSGLLTLLNTYYYGNNTFPPHSYGNIYIY